MRHAAKARRCGARTRAGHPCRQAAVTGRNLPQRDRIPGKRSAPPHLCSFAQLTSTVPSHIPSNAPSAGGCLWPTMPPQAIRVRRSIFCASNRLGRTAAAPHHKPIASQSTQMVMPVHAGTLRSGCNCHGPQRQQACLWYRNGDLRDRGSCVNVTDTGA
jgi:hypothetical protein